MENKKLWNALKYFLLTLLCIGLVSYIIYHLVLSLDDSVQTVPTTLVTAEETVSQEGYIFRTEQIVYATPGSFSYRIDDGKRAAKGVALLDVYDSDTSAAAQTELKMLDRRITRLKTAICSRACSIPTQPSSTMKSAIFIIRFCRRCATGRWILPYRKRRILFLR